jgi:transposase
MIGATEILKTDDLGRVRVPRERQEQLLDEFERSGLSGAKFAALCGVNYPSFAGWVLRQIRNLYALEARLRKTNAGPRLRHARRAAEAAPILTRLKKGLDILRRSGRHLPQSDMGKALSYALGQLPKLQPYLNDGRIDIDNNGVENAIRPTALGKKNYLFFGDAEAGETSAILYTIIESARRRGLDPEAYLKDVLTRLPSMKQSELGRVTPAAWAKARKTAVA